MEIWPARNDKDETEVGFTDIRFNSEEEAKRVYLAEKPFVQRLLIKFGMVRRAIKPNKDGEYVLKFSDEKLMDAAHYLGNVSVRSAHSPLYHVRDRGAEAQGLANQIWHYFENTYRAVSIDPESPENKGFTQDELIVRGVPTNIFNVTPNEFKGNSQQ